MKAENFLFIITTVGIFGLFATILYFETNQTVEPVKTIDFNVLVDFNVMHDRFDRLEIGIQNTSTDICFMHGGQWMVDENALVWQEIRPGTEAAFCMRQKT